MLSLRCVCPQLVRHAALLAFASLGIVVAPVAHATTITLLTSGDYDNAGNWQYHTVPGASDTAVIDGLTAIKTGGTLTASLVQLLNAAVLDFSTNSTLNADVSFTNGSSINLDGNVAGGMTLTIATGTSLTGSIGSIGYTDPTQGDPGTVAIINNAAITNNAANNTAFLYNVTNHGTISAINGGSLSYTYATAPTQSVNASDGTISVSGGGDLNFTGRNQGTISVANGNLSGNLYSTGTINLTNAPLTGYAILSGNAALNVTGGLQINGGALYFGGNTFQIDNKTITLSNSGELNFSGNYTLSNSVAFTTGSNIITLDGNAPGGTTLTIASGTSLTGNIHSVGYPYNSFSNPVSVINYGTIINNAANNTAYLYNVTNHGTISATNGGSFNYGFTYPFPQSANASDGTITVSGGENLSFSGTNDGTINLTNGNLGGTFTSTGTLNVNNAPLTGSTTLTDSAVLNVTGGLKINGGALYVSSGTIFNIGSGNIALDNGTLGFSSNQTLNNSVDFANNSGIFVDGNATGGTTLIIAKGSRLTGSISIIGYPYNNSNNPVSVINYGTIINNAANNTASLYNVTNHSTISAINGGSLNYGNTYSFPQSANASDGTISVSGGNLSFSGTNNGTINLTNGNLEGTFTSMGILNLNNAPLTGSATLLDNATLNVTGGLKIDGGILCFSGNTINNGTNPITLSNNAHLNFSGNQTLNDSVDFAVSNTYYSGSISLDGAVAGGTTLTIASGASLTGSIDRIGDAYNNFNNPVSVINNGTITQNNTTYSGILYNITNNGTITATDQSTIYFFGHQPLNNGNLVAAVNGTIDASNYGINQTAGKTTVNGTLTLGNQTLSLAGGTLAGSGIINANNGTVAVNNTGGTVSPGNSPGKLTINGDYTQSTNGIFFEEIGGTSGGTTFDQLVVSGTAIVGGTLQVKLVNGFTPFNGETFDFFYATALSGNFDNIVSETPGYSFTYSVTGSIGNIVVATTTAVPEGSTGLLALLGIIPAVLLQRKLRRQPVGGKSPAAARGRI